MGYEPNVLLVEDSEMMIDVVTDELAKVGVNVTVARSRAAAEQVAGDRYQLAICDLSIPSRDRLFDASPEHGLAVLRTLRAINPALQIIVFSGQVDAAALTDQISDGQGEITVLAEKARSFRAGMNPPWLEAVFGLFGGGFVVGFG